MEFYLTSPITIYQIFLYIVTGMTKERDIVLPITFGSCILFAVGLIFAYFLVPAALKFFIAYGADVVEPLVI